MSRVAVTREANQTEKKQRQFTVFISSVPYLLGLKEVREVWREPHALVVALENMWKVTGCPLRVNITLSHCEDS